MFLIALSVLLICLIMVLIRLYSGPTVYDRVLALNSFGTHTVLLIGVVGFLVDRPDFLDVALLYALLNFAGTIAVLKYRRYKVIGDVPKPSEGEGRP